MHTLKLHSVTERFRRLKIDAISLNFQQTPEQAYKSKMNYRYAPMAFTGRINNLGQWRKLNKIKNLQKCRIKQPMCSVGVYRKNQQVRLGDFTDRSRTTDQIGPFTHFWGNEITQILPGYFIPPRRTLRSNITAAPFNARRIEAG
ncbi:hypothetical protein F7N59_22275 [Escherichia coli]|nr:hypothetical protein [Escherichia coli]